MTGTIAESKQELREDRPGIAARAIERRIGRAYQQTARVRFWLTIEGAQHCRQCHRHVGPGVAIGDGKHVDLVDVIGFFEQPIDARTQYVSEDETIEFGNRCGR